MTWNHRIVRRLDGSYGLHEVFYRNHYDPFDTTTARPFAMTVDAVTCSAKMRKAAEARPIFVEPKRWAKCR